VLGISIDELMGAHSPARPQRTLQKTKSGISFIYFDVNGCLVHFYQRAFAKLAQATGCPSDVVEDGLLALQRRRLPRRYQS